MRRMYFHVVVMVLMAAMESCSTTPQPAANAVALRQEQAVAEIKKCGGTVIRDGESSDGPVIEVTFDRKGSPDSCMEYVKELQQLRALNLSTTPVLDAGMAAVGDVHQLQSLNLNFTAVTDAGLEHLGTLKQLQTLFLFGTKVTGAGVRKLQTALPGCEMRWDEGRRAVPH